METPEINPAYMVNYFMTEKPRIYNGKKTVISINDVGKTGQPHAK